MSAMNNPYLLYLVTDEHLETASLLHIVEQAIFGGVTMVQLREKGNDVQHFIAKGLALKELVTPLGIPLIINDRVDVALAVEADGVHLGQSDMPVHFARQLLGPNKLIGLSVENEAQLLESARLPIDYIGLSAIFASQTKRDTLREWGIAGLQRAVAQSELPVVAIGGIDQRNITEVAATGAAGIALVSAICHAEDPKLAALQLCDRIALGQSK